MTNIKLNSSFKLKIEYRISYESIIQILKVEYQTTFQHSNFNIEYQAET